jgi:hypothetical protein
MQNSYPSPSKNVVKSVATVDILSAGVVATKDCYSVIAKQYRFRVLHRFDWPMESIIHRHADQVPHRY